MKKLIIFLISMLLSTSVFALSYSVNPATGVFTETSGEPVITNLPAANLQARYYGTDEYAILVTTTSKAWLNIGNFWYVLPSTSSFDLVIDEEGGPIPPDNALASAGPYTAEPILKYEEVPVTQAFGSCTKLVKIGPNWYKLPCSCKAGYHLARRDDGHGHIFYVCIKN